MRLRPARGLPAFHSADRSHPADGQGPPTPSLLHPAGRPGTLRHPTEIGIAGHGPFRHCARKENVQGSALKIQVPGPTDLRSFEDTGHYQCGEISSPGERQRITILLDPYMLAKIESISVSVQPRRISRT